VIEPAHLVARDEEKTRADRQARIERVLETFPALSRGARWLR
jgi:hypothetical protein